MGPQATLFIFARPLFGCCQPGSAGWQQKFNEQAWAMFLLVCSLLPRWTIIFPCSFHFRSTRASQIANSSIVQTSRVPTKLSYFGLDSSNSSHLPMLLQLLFPTASPLLALTKSKRGRNFCLLAIFAFLLLLECPQLGAATQDMDIEKSAELNQARNIG